MKQNSIEDLKNLKTENYENIFNVYTDENNRYFYNLLQSVSLPQNLPAGYYSTYNIQYGDTWPLISYKNYKTPNLWWIILAANNINNPTALPVPGSQISILNNKVAQIILNQTSTQTND
jgi:nucleoid-associated protein YgaU